jgi:iron complex outermembrane receptor protein
MKVALCGASRVAILASLSSLAFPVVALAQQPPPPEEATVVDELVVTGSLIRGTPIDAALPVEVYTQENLELQGAPTALEFAKSLTIAGPTTGEAYYFGGAGLTGVVAYNLRGIGADKTLTLLNGRRMSENASAIPSLALARTEVLKDGAAVTYGADAIGGVVNFITRSRFVGLEATGQYKYIDGSDGDYSVGVLGGWGEDYVNFLWSAEWEHRSRLSTMDRPSITNPSFDPSSPNWNPAPWSNLTNVSAWLPRGALPATPSVANEFGSPVAGFVNDFTSDSCRAFGGNPVPPAGAIPTSTCNYNYIPYYNLVEENDIYRLYGQVNGEISDAMNFHGEVSYTKAVTPKAFGSPAQPVIRGPALATGVFSQFYVPITNPHAAAFAARNSVTGAAQGFTSGLYRAFAHGGNPYLGGGDGFGVPSRIEIETFRVSGGVQGFLGDWTGPLGDVGYDVALTYNNSNTYGDAADVLGYRLQEALNGFGGPNCSVPDLDPARFGTQNAALAGTGDCMWWNPFVTAFPDQPVRGLDNPGYVAGAENNEELARWIFNPRASESINENVALDIVFDGQLGLSLPGGDVGWAAGFQARRIETRQIVDDPLYNGTLACEWPLNFTSANGVGSGNLPATPNSPTDPNFRGCTPDAPGPFVFFGTNVPDSAELRQHSFFGELQLPVTDALNLQLAVRNEQFSTVEGETVYKVAGRWDVFGPLSLRGSYGTNYQAPPVGAIPGEVTNAVRSYTVASGNWLGAQFITDANLKPETATTWNVGVIWQSLGFRDSHDVQVILDYFDIETEDEIGQLADPNQIAGLVFNGPGNTITTCDPTVQPLLNRVTFNAGCSVGLVATGAFSSISTLFGNGPGQTTNGYDLQATYYMPAGDGDLTLGLTATYVTELKTGPSFLDGVQVSTGDDRLGFLNFQTIAAAAPKLRANFSGNYAVGQQNFRLGVNFVSRVRDERPDVPDFQYGEFGEDWITADFTYRRSFDNDVTLTATVANIFDRDPPPAQEELGYDPRLGNPLGRTFEIGLRKAF